MSTHFQQYYRAKGSEVEVAGLPEVDVTHFEQVKNAVKLFNPTVAINATGITDVDWAETNQEATTEVNVKGAENIARACKEGGVYMVHTSTGYVHDSQNERSEADQPNPINFYSYSKAKADEALSMQAKQGLKLLIIRPNMLLSAVPHSKKRFS